MALPEIISGNFWRSDLSQQKNLQWIPILLETYSTLMQNNKKKSSNKYNIHYICFQNAKLHLYLAPVLVPTMVEAAALKGNSAANMSWKEYIIFLSYAFLAHITHFSLLYMIYIGYIYD